MLVPWLMMVTLAPGTAAPLGSVTWPTRVPYRTCANPARGTARIVAKTIAANNTMPRKVEIFLQQLESIRLIASILLKLTLRGVATYPLGPDRVREAHRATVIG